MSGIVEGAFLGLAIYAQQLPREQWELAIKDTYPAYQCAVLTGPQQGAQAWAPSVWEALRLLSYNQLIGDDETTVTIQCGQH